MYTRIVIGIALYLIGFSSYSQIPTNLIKPTQPDQVLVVYNANYTADQNVNGISDGIEIATYYRNQRQIPSINVVSLNISTSEIINRTDFNNQIKLPLESYLNSTVDEEGTLLKNKIQYIVLCKGMPLKIPHFDGGTQQCQSPLGEPPTEDWSSVDAAVALLFQSYPIDGRIDNPYFNVDPSRTLNYRFKAFHFGMLSYLVTRLDAYSISDITSMIDRSIAPSLNLNEDAFVIDDHPNSFTDYMSVAYIKLKAMNLNVNPDPWIESTNYITTNPIPVIGYISYGVHAGMPSNYIQNTLNFSYANGAICTSYESFNAWSFTNGNRNGQGLIADFIQKGGTGAIGHVYEPCNSGIAHEDILFPMYAAGYSFVDAAYMAMPYLDWVNVVVGDPLLSVVSNVYADFKASSSHGKTPFIVDFTDLSAGENTTLTSWEWDFNNDGSIDSYEQNPSFTYTVSGNYSVKLTVSDGSKSNTRIISNLIKAVSINIEFSATPLTGLSPLQVTFLDLTTVQNSTITSWSWDFNNDGVAESTLQNPAYLFQTSGQFTVRLVVSDGTISDTLAKNNYIVTELDQFTKVASAGDLSIVSGGCQSASWIDYDEDGDQDILLTTATTASLELLFRNDSNNIFTRVSSNTITTNPGLTISGVWGDYNNDSHIDLYISRNEWQTPLTNVHGYLYTGMGNGSYSEPILMDINNPNAQGVSWADTDNDGDLDLYISHSTTADEILINEGNGIFVQKTMIQQSNHSTFTDYDNDGDLDLLLVGNYQPKLMRNEGANIFVETMSLDAGYGLLGSSWADIDNDGDMDVFTVDGRLFRNESNSTFTRIDNNSLNSGLGSNFGDIDNDGDVDLIVTGFSGSMRYSTLYWNDGIGNFMSANSSIVFSESGASFTNALADYDSDGDIDILIANWNQPSYLFRNNNENKNFNRWINIKLIGTVSNKSAIGAKVFVKTIVNGQTLTQKREVTCQSGGGRGSQSSFESEFGIGNVQSIQEIKVEWPSGITQILSDVQPNQFLTLTEVIPPDFVKAMYRTTVASGKAPLQVQFIDQSAGANITGWEWDFNNDGIVDATNQNPTYTYTDGGNYTVKLHVTNGINSDDETKVDLVHVVNLQALFIADTTTGKEPLTVNFIDQSIAENTTITSWKWDFNCDGIIDTTLQNSSFTYVESDSYSVSLVISDGYFSDTVKYSNYIAVKETRLISQGTGGVESNGEQLAGASLGDYDLDGKLDLFIAVGQGSPWASSRIYRQIGGNHFQLMTTVSPFTLSEMGNWFDFDRDGDLDLVVSYHNWDNDYYPDPTQGPIMLYRNEGVLGFVAVQNLMTKPGASHYNGTVDVDNDGDLDVFNENDLSCQYCDNKKDRLYINDNGNFTLLTNDPLVMNSNQAFGASWSDYDNDNDLDVFIPNNKSTDQTNFLFRNNGGVFERIAEGVLATSSTVQYNNTSCWGDFDNDGDFDLILQKTYVVSQPDSNVTYLYFENNGNGSFAEVGHYVMPPYFPGDNDVFSMAPGDFDNDGDLDVFIANYSNYSFILINNGKGKFYRSYFDPNDNFFYPSLFSVSIGDINNDGFLDIFGVDYGSGNNSDLLMINEGNSNNWLKIKLRGTISNNYGIGAKVKVKSTVFGKTYWQVRELMGQIGNYTTSALEAHFGLGDATQVESIIVEWPSGIKQSWSNVLTNQELTLREERPPVDYVILATNSANIKSRTIIASGNVGVNDIGSGSLPNGKELKLDTAVVALSTTNIKANRIRLNPNSQVGGDLFYNQVTNMGGVILGNQITPLTIPLFSSLPKFISTSSPYTTQDLTVNTPGYSIQNSNKWWKDIIVNNNAVLEIDADTIYVESLTIKQRAKLYFYRPTIVLLKGCLLTQNNNHYIGPHKNTSLTGSDIIFFISGTDSGSVKASKFTTNDTLICNMYVPNGSVTMGNFNRVSGAILCKDLVSGTDNFFELDSYFNYDNVLGKRKLSNGVSKKISDFKLYQNFPNPFNPTTTFSFDLPTASGINIQIFNILGQEVFDFGVRNYEVGAHKVLWNGTDKNGRQVASGIYIYRVVVEPLGSGKRLTSSRKMLLLK